MQALILASIPDRSMKSIGNKGMIVVDQRNRLIDYQIKQLKKIDKNIHIFVVCAFDSRKLISYINSKRYENVLCLNHSYTDHTNIGQSVIEACKYIDSHKPIIMMTNGCLFKHTIFKSAKLNYNKSYAIISNNKNFESKIGCNIINDKLNFIFYDLENKLCEIFILDSKNIEILKNNIKHINKKMYLFEVINKIMELGGSFYPYITRNPCLIIDTNTKIHNINIGLYK